MKITLGILTFAIITSWLVGFTTNAECLNRLKAYSAGWRW